MGKYPEYVIDISKTRWNILEQTKYDKSLLLFITGRCNLNCSNCFSASSRDDKEMSVNQVIEIIRANPSFLKIDLMGGEPLLHPDINRIIQTLKEFDRQVSVYTNGLLLNHISSDVMPVRICVSFHELTSNIPSRKPLDSIVGELLRMYDQGNKIKLVFLIDAWNYTKTLDVLRYVDENMHYINKLTLGLVRNEADYWNDECFGILPFRKYADVVQKVLKEYNGRLDIDVFRKGVLVFDTNDDYHVNRTNRFKCVFPDDTFTDCLYKAYDVNRHHLPKSFELPPEREYCQFTGLRSCLADKIRLTANNVS